MKGKGKFSSEVNISPMTDGVFAFSESEKLTHSLSKINPFFEQQVKKNKVKWNMVSRSSGTTKWDTGNPKWHLNL